MIIGYYPGWEEGFVSEYLARLSGDGQRKKAEAKLRGDLYALLVAWPRPAGVEVRRMAGYDPLWELKRDFQGIAYRIFFCVHGDEVWLLSALEKKRDKTPRAALRAAYRRMRDVLGGNVRRPR
ncbi:MAG: type II toxin-antitoxin system RelE/ParE family toxin [Elusimicrobia bacterium]|nr:type II toxin-antitoxin system RelE/ParE family toxin [Elusimicrobiota bacterium]